MITGHTQTYAVIGRPVEHSGSPALHNRWFRERDIDAVYVALDVAPGDGDQVMAALRTLNLAGANLTVPHKHAVVPHLDHVSADVATLGAANTVVRRGDEWHGYNTDVQGFVDAFIASHGDTLAGRRVVLLGAGGAGVAVALGLVNQGVDHIHLCNRTVDRAVREAERLGERVSAHTLSDARALAVGADLVVNALSGPGADAATRIDPAVLSKNAVWCDLNYWMPAPPGLEACAQASVPYLTGHAMLHHQAALAFAHFTGTSLPTVSNVARLE